MRNRVKFNSVQRRTTNQDGIINVVMTSTDASNETSRSIGTIVRPSDVNTFIPVTLSGKAMGPLRSRNLAAGVLKRQFQANGDGADVSICLADAASILSPDANNPVAALKKKISRGSVKTVVVDGETRVVL